MNIFIYDSFLNQKKYDRVLARIETRITDLGLNGKIDKLDPMKNINEIVGQEIKRGAKSIIVVGNDQTINKIANIMVNCQIPLGIIPIDKKNNDIAQALGIEFEESACESLSARRIARIDVGLANNACFLLRAMITNQGTTIEINQNYSVEINDKKGETQIINLLPPDVVVPIKNQISPQDGILDLFIKTKTAKNIFSQKNNYSLFQIKKILIKNKRFPIVLDNAKSIAAPVKISLLKQKLNIIVGRNRNF